jgi:hypothetical protein
MNHWFIKENTKWSKRELCEELGLVPVAEINKKRLTPKQQQETETRLLNANYTPLG